MAGVSLVTRFGFHELFIVAEKVPRPALEPYFNVTGIMILESSFLPSWYWCEEGPRPT